MASEFKLRAVMEYIDRSGPGIQKTEQNLGSLEKMVNAAGAALATFASIQTVRATYELARLGAQSIRTHTAFDAISGGSYRAAQNLNAMRRATRGALSEMEMMAAANRLMQMGLARNSEELERLTTMAVRLGTAMNRTVSQSIEEFSLLLANQSIQRLDTFGISAGRVRQRIRELQATTVGLTREQAFLQAVMEEGQRAMERLGDQTEDEALAFERLEASWADLKTVAGEMLAPALAEVVGGLADITREMVEQRREIDRIRDAYVEYGFRVSEISGRAGVGLEQMHARLRAVDAEVARLSGLADYYAEKAEAAAEATAILNEHELEASEILRQAASAMRTAGVESERMRLAQDALAMALGEMTIEEYAQKQAMIELATQYQEGMITLGEYINMVMELKAAWEQVPTDITTVYHVDVQGAPQSILEAPMGGVAWRQGGGSVAGWAVVGEAGPEMVLLPRGSFVVPAYETRQIINQTFNRGGDTIIVNDAAAMAVLMEQRRREMMDRVMEAL